MANGLTMGQAVGHAFSDQGKRFVLTKAAFGLALVMATALAVFLFFNREGVVAYLDWYALFLASVSAGGPPDLPRVPPEVAALVPGYLAMIAVFLLGFAAFEAACLRWLVRGEETAGLLGLGFGADTWRVLVIYLLWIVLLLATVLAALIPLVIVTFGFVMLSANNPAMAALGPLVTTFLLYAVLIYVGVRFAPAAATSVGAKRIAFLEARKVTKGRFWTLFGAFAFVILLVMIAGLAAWAIAGVSVFSAPMRAAREGAAVSESLMTALSQPSAWLILGGVYLGQLTLAMVFYVVLFGINAKAAVVAHGEGKV